MKRLALAALALGAGSAAQAQSMNVPLITERVVRDICGPFIDTGDMWPAIAAAGRAGYGTVHVRPPHIRIGAADAQPEPVEIELRGAHAGTLRMRDEHGLLVCSVGVHEGGVGQIAEAAGPHLRALGYAPVLDDRSGALALSVWRGGARQVLIAPSTEFRPGAELVMTGPAPGQAD